MRNQEIKKVLVTGYKGLIGSYVYSDWCETHGHHVTGIDEPDDIVDFNGGDYDAVIHLVPLLTFGTVSKIQKVFTSTMLSKLKSFLTGVGKLMPACCMPLLVPLMVTTGKIPMQ